jgi:hypothetical protein
VGWRETGAIEDLAVLAGSDGGRGAEVRETPGSGAHANALRVATPTVTRAEALSHDHMLLVDVAGERTNSSWDGSFARINSVL